MIVLDSNVFMYAAGAEHPHRASSQALLRRVLGGEVEATSDCEVLQEILHRYRAIGRWSDGQRVFDLARDVVAEFVPITPELAEQARSLMNSVPALTARDAIHAAATLRLGAFAICSFDTDFDAVPNLKRLEPGELP